MAGGSWEVSENEDAAINGDLYQYEETAIKIQIDTRMGLTYFFLCCIFKVSKEQNCVLS